MLPQLWPELLSPLSFFNKYARFPFSRSPRSQRNAVDEPYTWIQPAWLLLASCSVSFLGWMLARRRLENSSSMHQQKPVQTQTTSEAAQAVVSSAAPTHNPDKQSNDSPEKKPNFAADPLPNPPAEDGIKVGTKVEARYAGGTTYFLAIVSSVSQDGTM